MPSAGRFAGKFSFGSSRGGFYLTTLTFKQGGDRGALLLPGMSATRVTDQEKCIAYRQADGSYRVQLGGLLWISLLAELGWLATSADPSTAVPLILEGTPRGSAWKARTSDGLKPVSYQIDTKSPLLTVNGGPDVLGDFVPAVLAPGLDDLLRTKSGRSGDFAHVDFGGADLSGLDLTAADFSAADLTGVRFAQAMLEGAHFKGARLAGITCDGANLDRADFSGGSLDGVAWGTPARARGLVLEGSSVRGATIGGQASPLDCTGARLGGGDFTGANLSGLLLGGANAAQAIFAGATLDRAVFSGGSLRGCIAVGASFRDARLDGCDAQGANFAHADLSGADLTRARLDARAYLFSVDGKLAAELDHFQYVQRGLIDAFKGHGVSLAPEAAVLVLVPGSRWQLQDPAGPYRLFLTAAGAIDVFRADTDSQPAVLRQALCRGTRAPGASLSGADLRGVIWFGERATLDHADLEGASLAGSLLQGVDFTQAYLAGADLSSCALVQSSFRGCVLGPGSSARAVSFEGAELHGVDFSDASLLGALLVDASVALRRGVPLFALGADAGPALTQSGLTSLRPRFAAAGYPLGASPKVVSVEMWVLDNRSDQEPLAPHTYRVQPNSAATSLLVFDQEASTYLFSLPIDAKRLLADAQPPPTLIALFARQQYSLAKSATIEAGGFWEVAPGTDAPVTGASSYPKLRVYPSPAELPVYGSVLVRLRDWQQYFPDGLAFAPTRGLETGLNPASLAPSGYPRAWFDQQRFSWDALLTAHRGAVAG